LSLAIDQQPKRSGTDTAFLESAKDVVIKTRRQRRIGMQKQKRVTRGDCGSSRELPPPAGRRLDNRRPMGTSDLTRPVRTSPIDHDHFPHAPTTHALERMADRPFLVDCENNDGQAS
jgi:hypothetical protein